MSEPLDPAAEAAVEAELSAVEGRLLGWVREQAVGHRRMLQSLLELQRAETRLGRGEFTPINVSLLMSVSEQRAHTWLGQARRLASLDRGWELYDALSVEQARVVLDGTDQLDVDVADQVVDAVLSRAAVTGGAGRRWVSDVVRRTRRRLVPDDVEKRRKRTVTDRRITAQQLEDDQVGLWVQGPKAEIAKIQIAIRDRVALDDWWQYDPRSLDARRFDALIELVAAGARCSCQARPPRSPDDTDTAPGGEVATVPPLTVPRLTVAGPRCGGRLARPGAGCCAGHTVRAAEADLPVITVLVPLATALALDDSDATQLPSTRKVPGGSALTGPMGAAEARTLMRDDVLWRAQALDPVTGQPVGPPIPPIRPWQSTAPPATRARHRRDPYPDPDPDPDTDTDTDTGTGTGTGTGMPPGPRGSALSDHELRTALQSLQQWVTSSPMLTRAAQARVAAGVDAYEIPDWIRTVVVARSVTCEFPDCLVPAERCDLDHDVAWPQGRTAPDNLGPLCRRHHRLKQTGWTKTRHPDGTLTWTSPTGRQHTRASWHPTPSTPLRTDLLTDQRARQTTDMLTDQPAAHAPAALPADESHDLVPVDDLERPPPGHLDGSDPWVDRDPDTHLAELLAQAAHDSPDDPWEGFDDAIHLAGLLDPLHAPDPGGTTPDPPPDPWTWIDDPYLHVPLPALT